ncbi:hypothetical protein H310_03487 [Aphanomyces invadans]|uniref:FZ domain-containing protein n=1 Tax=Aphanomyces invadans TaxID=157072 RepID=A0A024UHB4_9STRA|nr:hypothetical protein H310_03487 [Aphanomyces invadans]ETW05806.1 hypothetical protein H310_03487 [Aphanomyces invadans]|eukprot:XP_008865583.1 hypothetical protein H310_03487 [Aphanomyces invadans]
MRAAEVAALILLELLSPATSASCSNDQALSTAYSTAMNKKISPACARGGDWWKPSNETSLFITSYHRSYFPLPCTISACRQDFEASAAALRAVNCEEAQAAASAMAGVVQLCQTLSPAPMLPRCTKSDNAKMLDFPSACEDVVPNARTVNALLEVPLNQFGAICRASQCVDALRTAVNTLPDCRVDYPKDYSAAVPMSKKHVYQSYLSSFCSPNAALTKDFSSCYTKLAALYATPFSDECNTAVAGNVFFSPSKITNYALYRAQYDLYIYTTKVIAAIPSCAADLNNVVAAASDTGTCTCNITFGFQVLQLAHSKAFTPAPSSPPVAVCDKIQERQFQEKLAAAAPVVCTQSNPSSTQWYDVLLPPLPEISTVAAVPACVAAAVEYTATFPPCDLSYPAFGDSPAGIPIATRTIRYLLAAQTLMAAPTPMPTKSSTAESVKRGADGHLVWNVAMCMTAVACALGVL